MKEKRIKMCFQVIAYYIGRFSKDVFFSSRMEMYRPPGRLKDCCEMSGLGPYIPRFHNLCSIREYIYISHKTDRQTDRQTETKKNKQHEWKKR